MGDLYATLGVSKTATDKEIKNAYRSLAKKFHPDLNPGNKEAEHRFKKVNEAYDILSDAKKRQQYDQFGEAAFSAEGMGARAQQSRQGPFYYQTQDDDGRYSRSYSYGGGFDDDLFSSIFGQAAGGARARGRPRGPTPGEDELYQMEVEFRDAVAGAEREITLPSGKKLRVKIPPGIDSGQKLRFSGQGGPGLNGGPAGDVYVEIRVRPSNTFKRAGNDLEVELAVSLPEAVLGGEVRAPTVTGGVMLKIPSGVSSGAKLRLRGKGVPAHGTQAAGDLLVTVKIVMPEKIDDELRAFMEAWKAKHDYDPRDKNQGGSHAA